MSVGLTTEKEKAIKDAVIKLKGMGQSSTMMVAQVTGKIVACFPAVTPGPLNYRKMHMKKSEAVTEVAGNFEAKMTLSNEAYQDINWWIDNPEGTQKPLHREPPEVFIIIGSPLRCSSS